MATLAVLLLWAVSTHAQTCVEQCLTASVDGPTVCTSDGVTRAVTPTSIDCLWYCNVTVSYPGPCGCPNNCYEELDHGKCSEGADDKRCICTNAWNGADCSRVRCPANICSEHGACQIGGEGGDMCVCHDGWTDPNCATQTIRYVPLPYGEPLDGKDNERAYWAPGEEYGDQHPLFNTSGVGEVYVRIAAADLRRLVDPVNAYSGLAVNANVTFFMESGDIWMTRAARVNLFGNTTQQAAKKSYRINIVGDPFFGLSSFLLRSTGTDVSLVTEAVVGEMFRALNVPTQRSAPVAVWVNDVFYGVYWLADAVSPEFIKARYEKPTGSLYMCRSGAFLLNEGRDPEAYKNKTTSSARGRYVRPVYQDMRADSNFEDLVGLVVAVNEGSVEDDLDDVFSIRRYLRVLALEVCVANWNAYAYYGTDYILYNNEGAFEMLRVDYDSTMNIARNGESADFWMGISPYSWGNTTGFWAPLVRRVLESPEHRAYYTAMFRVILLTLFGPTTPLFRRLDDFRGLLNNSVALDRFYELGGVSWDVNLFLDAVPLTIKPYVIGRYRNASRDLEPAPPTPAPPGPDTGFRLTRIILIVVGCIMAVIIVTGVTVMWFSRKRASDIEASGHVYTPTLVEVDVTEQSGAFEAPVVTPGSGGAAAGGATPGGGGGDASKDEARPLLSRVA